MTPFETCCGHRVFLLRGASVVLFLIGSGGCKQAAVPTSPPPAPAANAPTSVPKAAATTSSDAASSPPLKSSPFWEAAAKEREQAQETESAEPRTYVPLPKPQVDDQKASAAGIRKLQGRHLVLYTDIPSRAEIDGLCELADLAYPQWCAYFQVAEAEQPDWQMIGYLMQDKQKFQAAGLFPDNLPQFIYGFCRDHEFWVHDQQASDYYRRHLLLHEMTHGFMYTRLQGERTAMVHGRNR